MILTASLSDVGQRGGVILLALLAASAVLAPARRAQAAAVLGTLLLAPVLLLAEIWDTPQLESVRDRPVLAVAGGVLGALAVLGLAAVMHRRPLVLPVAVVAMLPFRVPIEAGAKTSNLLVPLYLVIGAGALAHVWRLWRESPGGPAPDPVDELLVDDKPREDGPRALDPPGAGWLAWLLVGSVVVYAAQAAYSESFDRALQQVVFFYAPFALLFMLLARTTWSRRLAGLCLAVVVAEALAFAGIGFYEYAVRETLIAPKSLATQEFQSYFRVSSVFFDPNVYGRFLVLVMLAVTAAMLWPSRPRLVPTAAVVLAVLWGGLVLTLSQSSFGALLVGLVVLGGLRWGPGRAAAIVGGTAVIGMVVVLALPDLVRLDLGSGEKLNRTTSGRTELIEGGADLFSQRPLQGFGPASFEAEYREQKNVSGNTAAAASHTIPLTVAAEQGIGGLLLYLSLLAAAFWRLLRRASRSAERAAIAAAFAALVFHTWVYAGFLEDPFTWALLGIGTALAYGDGRGRAEGPAAELA